MNEECRRSLKKISNYLPIIKEANTPMFKLMYASVKEGSNKMNFS